LASSKHGKSIGLGKRPHVNVAATWSLRWSLVCSRFCAAAAQVKVAGGEALHCGCGHRGVTPVIGREILSADSEARWLRARATAEAIKSECFRFAAKLGDYAGPGAQSAFAARRDALAEPAERAG
jgi:hypothetical protein